MILGKDKNMIKHLKWLKTLRKLVISDMQKMKPNDETACLDIFEFEEWLHEIDAEISMISI